MTDYTDRTAAIKALSDAQARERLEDLATQLTGTDRWSGELAKILDMQPRTLNKWREDDKRPPTWALLFLEATLEAKYFRAFHSSYLATHNLATQLADL